MSGPTGAAGAPNSGMGPGSIASAVRMASSSTAASAPPRRTEPLRAAPVPPKRIKAWIELPLLGLAAIVVTLVVKALLAQAFYIPSGSMEPQLHVNDRVVVSRTAYRLHDPNRGDIVVFPSPIAEPEHHGLVDGVVDDVLDALAVGDRGDDELIKRVIGLPGEEVEARDGEVLIDGEVLREPYLPAGVRTEDFGPVEGARRPGLRDGGQPGQLARQPLQRRRHHRHRRPGGPGHRPGLAALAHGVPVALRE